MARVWLVFEGPQQLGEPVGDLLVEECAVKLNLQRRHRMPKGEAPKFRGQRDRLREPSHVVVEVFDGEDPTWPAGFYDAPVSPDQARLALLD